ncbi:ABC transporter ATP-binding protein [Alkalibacillus haloalkaliphilus]|nr:ABC transporter ATP-binding protein [Alkalibacillus haloalkaliphilus]
MTQLKPLIEVDQFSFDYEQLNEPLVSEVSFNINKDETVLLMGSSGSGKSTISLCLNGLYPEAVEGVASGDIFFKGNNIKDFEKGELNQNVGIVFQDPESQFCMITVENELAFTLENIQTPREEIAPKIDQVLETIGMIDYKYHNIHELSGGQKQKVALASVLLLDPELIILDEPTANLDPVSSLVFVNLIKDLKLETQKSIFIIEHKADDWLTFTDRVLVLNKQGQLVADDSPKSLFTTNKTLIENEGLFIPKVYQKQMLQPQNEVKNETSEASMVINDLSFSRKKTLILNSINMTLNKGEMIAIVGENGAGKSTLLQLMAGILKPKKGNITFLGHSLQKWKEQKLRQHMGFVFQNPEHQFITDTTYDEVSFGMTLNGYSEDVIKERTEQLLQNFQLSAHKWSNPFALSGGQKRRLSVATMLDETPDLLLFDEPTFGQDAQTTDELMTIVKDLQAKGTTIVFVTHDMDLVDLYCDQVYVINDQQVAFEGHPHQLWKQDALLERARLRLPDRLRHGQEVGETYDLVY